MKKYIVTEDSPTGKTRFEVITDELGYLHKQPEPEPEVKPVSLKEIERLYKKEFPESQSQPKPVNEIKRLHKMLNE